MAKLKKNEVNIKSEDIINEDVEENVKPEKVKVKTKQQLAVELNKIQKDIFVEVLNISIGRTLYMNKYEDVIIDLEPGESTSISLEKAKEICDKAKKFFSDGSLLLKDVYNEEYSLKEILMFLKLDKVNVDEVDFVQDLITEEDDNRFESILKSKDKKFIKKVAARAIYLNSLDEFDLSRTKERIICDLLNLDDLIY